MQRFEICKFLTKKRRPFKFFWNFAQKRVFVVYFCKMEKLLECSIHGHIKNHCWNSIYWKLRLWKTVVVKLRAAKNSVSFFKRFSVSVAFARLLSKTLLKNVLFLMQIFEIQFKILYLAKFYNIQSTATKIAALSM